MSRRQSSFAQLTIFSRCRADIAVYLSQYTIPSHTWIPSHWYIYGARNGASPPPGDHGLTEKCRICCCAPLVLAARLFLPYYVQWCYSHSARTTHSCRGCIECPLQHVVQCLYWRGVDCNEWSIEEFPALLLLLVFTMEYISIEEDTNAPHVYILYILISMMWGWECSRGRWWCANLSFVSSVKMYWKYAIFRPLNMPRITKMKYSILSSLSWLYGSI